MLRSGAKHREPARPGFKATELGNAVDRQRLVLALGSSCRRPGRPHVPTRHCRHFREAKGYCPSRNIRLLSKTSQRQWLKRSPFRGALIRIGVPASSMLLPTDFDLVTARVVALFARKTVATGNSPESRADVNDLPQRVASKTFIDAHQI
jgi:hypothetical protein